MAISTFTPGGNEALSSGTSDTTVVAAPAANTQRLISSIKVFNQDTIAHIVTVQIAKASNNFILYFNAVLAVNESFELRDFVLDATDETVEITLGEAATTTEVAVVSTFVDKA